MTQEDKVLLAKDLFSRALSGIKVNYRGDVYTLGYNMYLEGSDMAFESYPMKYFLDNVDEVKPYLRPMSSMTEEERLEYYRRCKSHHYRRTWKYGRNQYGELLYRKESTSYTAFCQTPEALDYLNSIHVDYRGMIKKGLALKAPKGMYEVQN